MTVHDDEPASLSRQEVACLKTALALVIVKRRVFEKQQANSNNERARLEEPLVPGFEEPPPLRGDERWAQHVSHMMELARNELEQQVAADPNNSVSSRRRLARLDSLAMHVACQLEAWFKETSTACDSSSLLDEDEHTPVQQWIHAQLKTHPHEYLWLLILRAKPTVVAQLLVPVLCELLLPKHDNNNDMQTVGHWCNLLHAAVWQAPAETCRDALASWNTTTTMPSVHDLAFHYHHSSSGSHLLWQCASADLVQEFLVRLSQLGGSGSYATHY